MVWIVPCKQHFCMIVWISNWNLVIDQIYGWMRKKMGDQHDRPLEGGKWESTRGSHLFFIMTERKKKIYESCHRFDVKGITKYRNNSVSSPIFLTNQFLSASSTSDPCRLISNWRTYDRTRIIILFDSHVFAQWIVGKGWFYNVDWFLRIFRMN